MPVVDTDFVTWEPDANGRYPIQALHYSVMHPHVLRTHDDLAMDRSRPGSSALADRRSRLWTYGVAVRASDYVLNEDGTPHPPIAPGRDDSFYEGRNLRLDTATFRRDTSEAYRQLGESMF